MSQLNEAEEIEKLDENNPLGHDAFIEAETAIFCISQMIGDTSTLILIEKAKEYPDSATIKTLEDERKVFLGEREVIYH